MTTPAVLFGLGVGPGDPELLTLKALRILRAAPVLAYPAPLTGESMARSIVAEHLDAGERIEIPLRMNFDTDRTSANQAYDAGAEAIALHLQAGRTVAVLCEGDPFLFGSFIYLFGRLCGRFPIEVVPGVSSIQACSAALGAPLSALDDRVAVIPATRAEDEIERLLAVVDSAAIVKAGRHLPKIARVLERLGLLDKARYIERAGLPEQRIRPFAEAAAAGGPYFSMVLVHKRGEAWQ